MAGGCAPINPSAMAGEAVDANDSPLLVGDVVEKIGGSEIGTIGIVTSFPKPHLVKVTVKGTGRPLKAQSTLNFQLKVPAAIDERSPSEGDSEAVSESEEGGLRLAPSPAASDATSRRRSRISSGDGTAHPESQRRRVDEAWRHRSVRQRRSSSSSFPESDFDTSSNVPREFISQCEMRFLIDQIDADANTLLRLLRKVLGNRYTPSDDNDQGSLRQKCRRKCIDICKLVQDGSARLTWRHVKALPARDIEDLCIRAGEIDVMDDDGETLPTEQLGELLAIHVRSNCMS